MAHHTRLPAEASPNEQVVCLGAVLHDLGPLNTETCRSMRSVRMRRVRFASRKRPLSSGTDQPADTGHVTAIVHEVEHESYSKKSSSSEQQAHNSAR